MNKKGELTTGEIITWIIGIFAVIVFIAFIVGLDISKYSRHLPSTNANETDLSKDRIAQTVNCNGQEGILVGRLSGTKILYSDNNNPESYILIDGANLGVYRNGETIMYYANQASYNVGQIKDSKINVFSDRNYEAGLSDNSRQRLDSFITKLDGAVITAGNVVCNPL